MPYGPKFVGDQLFKKLLDFCSRCFNQVVLYLKRLGRSIRYKLSIKLSIFKMDNFII